jgi:hypothetical protein
LHKNYILFKQTSLKMMGLKSNKWVYSNTKSNTISHIPTSE